MHHTFDANAGVEFFNEFATISSLLADLLMPDLRANLNIIW